MADTDNSDVPSRRDSSINEAAVKRHALVEGELHRKGKFRRVSSEFVEHVRAEFEETLRKLANGADAPADNLFVFSVVETRLREQLNRNLASIIRRRVKQNLTGHTLY